jgi:hypothetical protein
MNTARSRISRLSRVIHLACAILVTCYIFFDVLDLDGSDWRFRPPPARSEVLIAKGLAEAEPISQPSWVESWAKLSNCFIDPPEDSAYFGRFELLAISVVESSRHHRYRVALPRSSIPDPVV